MTTHHRLALWIGPLLLACACGAQDDGPPGTPAPGSPHDLALRFVAAVPAGDPNAWIDMLVQPHDAAEYGWREGIRLALVELKDVRFEVIQPQDSSGEEDAGGTVEVRMTSPDADSRTAKGSLEYVRQGEDWRLTVESMIRFLEEGQAVATGVPRKVHKTWLLVHLLDFAIGAFPINRAVRGLDERFPNDWSEILDADMDCQRSEKGEPLDAWGRTLHYEVKPDGTYDIRSAGADGVLHTADDVTAKRPEPD